MVFRRRKGADSKTKKLIPPNARLLLPGTESVVGLVTMWPDNDGVIRRARYQTSVERETLEVSDLDPRIADFLRKEIRAGHAPDNLTHITALVAEKFKGKISTPTPEKK